VIARSNEAKALGIPMGAPAFQYESDFKAKGIQVFSSNYALYGDMSQRVMTLLAHYTPHIEVYSIDEAFLYFEGHSDLHRYGEQIRQEITQGTGIPISLGIAPTKALAKVANKIAKEENKNASSVYVIDSNEKRERALKQTKIKDIWGIGRKHAEKLAYLNLTNAYEFTKLPDGWVSKHMAVTGLRLKHDLEGKPTLQLEPATNKKNISITRSFDKNYTRQEDLAERISTFAATCGAKLRQQHSCARALMIFVNSNYHNGTKPYHGSLVIQLPYATSSNIDLVKNSLMLLRKIYKPGVAYKRAGVIALDLVPETPPQLTLFDQANPKHHKLMLSMDLLNQKYGDQKVKIATQDLNLTWKMKQERLSPRYTTKLTEVITCKA
jgi:DNA polymerase V